MCIWFIDILSIMLDCSRECWLSMVAHICYPRPGKAAAIRMMIGGHLGPQCEFEASLSYTKRSCLNLPHTKKVENIISNET
jgi:hypothetical protein